MSDAPEGVPPSGAIPIAAGQASVVRIPVPGEHRLAVELRTRDPRFRGRSTSTLFLQDTTGRRHLRLDYGFNPATNTVDYHWNQRGLFARTGIADHQTVGRGGALAYQTARAFRRVGGPLLVVGAGVDLVSIVHADRPLRRATQVASAWALAWVGCRGGGYLGGGLGTAVAPGPGTAAGALAGCIVGGAGMYRAGEALGDVVYQWADDTVFTPLPEVPVP